MIEIADLNFHYKKKLPILKDLSLKIDTGRVVGLFGMNGAGKTSLLKTICGLQFVNSGSIQVMDHNPSKRQPTFLQDLYLVPEELPEISLSIKKYTRLFSGFYPKFDSNELTRLLEEFQLDPSLKLSEISYGQKKKFYISFALATNAKLMVLDEPTNGLDIPSKSQFRKVLSASMSDDRTIIISTHQVRDLDTLIDQIVILNHGKIVYNKSIEETVNDYSFKYSLQSIEGLSPIYHEKLFNGYRAIFPNKEGEETRLDYELLFTAIVNHSENFN